MKLYTPSPIISFFWFQLVLLISCSATSSSNEDSSGYPVAQFTVSSLTASCGQSIQFDGGGSSHEDPSLIIAEYEWDFDYEGTVFNIEDTGEIVSHVFDSPGTLGFHTVALRVRDNSVKPRTDTATAQIEISFTNIQPVSDSGGPYIVYKSGDSPVSVSLDGSGSYDANSPCDEVCHYKWDTDNDGLFGEDDNDGTPWSDGADLTGVSPEIENADWSVGETKQISLIVYDSYGMGSSAAVTTVEVKN